MLQGLRRGIGPHNAIFIPAGTLFSLDLGKTGFGLAVQIPLNHGLPLPEDAVLLRVRDVQAQAEITGRLDTLQREISTARPFRHHAVTAHAILLAVCLRRQLGLQPADQSEDKRPTAAHRLVAAFCALVSRDYRSGKPMADYATMLGVTPTHLTRSCKDCCGMTAADLLTLRSLCAARDMIETTDLPLKDIGEALGFGSAAYFSRFVQHHTGSSPSALRKKAVPSTVTSR
ncbi:transcriptional regulator, AraC family [Thalassovita taeanensis]|uniref:Transcriptional regulator, AraC family n=2 Tax=Thalassovita taeanensis TaxID=657014 RepID=A0A1H8ZKK9_9RHOB|nr:transcriptional regulator, AraC family [Thalassovita taeanensis]